MTQLEWRSEILALATDLGVVEGALQQTSGYQVDKSQSLRWIERTRARLEQLAERMSTTTQPEEVRPQ